MFLSNCHLNKLRFIKPYKHSFKLEKYFIILNRQEAIAIFRLRTGMLKLKANFKSQHTSVLCSRCNSGETDDENHLLTGTALQHLRETFHLNSLNDAFHSNPCPHQLRKIASFVLAIDNIL